MAIPISNVTRRVVFAASGTGPYAFTFEILAAGDIAVYRDDTLLTLTTDYTVTINANGTGSITLTATPTGATQIAIVGNRTIARTTDFTTGGDFFANTLNNELDQQTIFAQQNAEGLARALQAPQTDPTTIDMTLPRKADRAGKFLAFDAVTGNPVPGAVPPELASVNAIAAEIAAVGAIDSEVTTVAGIDSEVTTVAGISSNVTTVAGVAANVTTVAGIAADVTAVAGDSTNIAAVAGVAADVAILGPIAGDITAAATIDTADLAAVAAIDADVGTVAGIAADVTTVAGISADVTTVAGDSADIATVAGVTGDLAIVAGVAADVTTVAGIAADVTAVAADATDIGTVASNLADITAVAAIDADVSTVATNIADVTNFSDVYLGAKTTNPTVRNDSSALVAGDLYFNTVAVEMRVYTGSGWVAATSSPDTVVEVAFTATAGQTSATFTGGYRVGFIYVFVNGVLLADADITATNGTTVTFGTALTLNDEVRMITFKAAGSLIVSDIGDLTASAAELNVLDGITASTAELNILDGVTASTAELNILDGVTASTAELNILDGVTASTAELNYVDGVTSAIQTQLNGKLTSSDIGSTVQGYDADTAKTDVAQAFTAAQRGTPVSLSSSSASIATNLALGNNFTHTFTENTTLANPTNLVAGQSGVIVFTQHSSSPKTLAYGTYWKFPGGTAPTVTASNSAVDVLAYYVESTTRITARLVSDVK